MPAIKAKGGEENDGKRYIVRAAHMPIARILLAVFKIATTPFIVPNTATLLSE